LWAIYQFLEAPKEACFMSQTLFSAGLIPQIKTWAPYAASIGRLGTETRFSSLEAKLAYWTSALSVLTG
jgi:hypothetical protein